MRKTMIALAVAALCGYIQYTPTDSYVVRDPNGGRV